MMKRVKCIRIIEISSSRTLRKSNNSLMIQRAEVWDLSWSKMLKYVEKNNSANTPKQQL